MIGGISVAAATSFVVTNLIPQANANNLGILTGDKTIQFFGSLYVWIFATVVNNKDCVQNESSIHMRTE